MTIEINRPEIEALIQQRACFHELGDLLGCRVLRLVDSAFCLIEIPPESYSEDVDFGQVGKKQDQRRDEQKHELK